MVVGVSGSPSDALESRALTFTRVQGGGVASGAAALAAAVQTAEAESGGSGAAAAASPAAQPANGPAGAATAPAQPQANGSAAAAPTPASPASAPAPAAAEEAGKGGGKAQPLQGMGARQLAFDPLKKISALASSGVDVSKDGHAARADPDTLPTDAS